MLPAAAVFHLPWEINSGFIQEGESLRTFGRLVSYQSEESRATLSAQHASNEHHVVVHTLFVEPFNPIIGAQYVVLGETENADGINVFSHYDGFQTNQTRPESEQRKSECVTRQNLLINIGKLPGVGLMIRARLLNCVDGVNIALLQKAINEQRQFFRERECKQAKDVQPADAT